MGMTKTKEKSSSRKNWREMLAIFGVISAAFMTFPLAVSGESAKTEVAGKVYEFDEDNDYEFSESKDFTESNDKNTYGIFSIEGSLSDDGTKDGVPSYEVEEGNVGIFYNYGDTMGNEDEDSWHLIEDKSDEVGDVELGSDILKGAIIVQTSKDRKNWVSVASKTNVFGSNENRTESLYKTEDVQLINGCYYRVIVAYEMSVRTKEGKVLFINTDKHDYKKYAEVYEFYAYTDSGEEVITDPELKHRLGETVRVAESTSYSGEEKIDKDDIHYGWELGDFFVSGYTDKMQDTDKNMVFLKNVGDKVTLWFRLNEDINKLRGNEKLKVTADDEGSDGYFQTPTMDFGRGTLIIRYTDYQNIKNEPTIYTNYLVADTAVGADTKVQLFEEGDYEVALDYQITDDKLIDKVGHYRIFFKFSVRNGNCMVYPFDVESGKELTNSTMTESGFKLDLAKSRYLKINLKREVMKDSADGLVEDTRSNGPARDGAEYTDEGIYTITVKNEYTDQTTVKKIYVGTNKILRAYMANMASGLTIPEINEMVKDGATISDDGVIQLANTVEVDAEVSEEETEPTPAQDVEEKVEEPVEKKSESKTMVIVIVGIIVLCLVGGIIVLKNRKKKQN